MKTILFAVMCVIGIAVHAQEMPYRLADLDGDFALTKSQLRQAAQVARVAAQEKRQPQGADVELYGAGTATLDLWLNVSPQSKAEVPDAPAYHRFVFRDGLPVALYRHGDGEPRLSCAYFYDRAMAPVAAVSYDGKKKTSRTACLIYDKDRRVKRVVEFDAEQKAAFAVVGFGCWAANCCGVRFRKPVPPKGPRMSCSKSWISSKLADQWTLPWPRPERPRRSVVRRRPSPRPVKSQTRPSVPPSTWQVAQLM